MTKLQLAIGLIRLDDLAKVITPLLPYIEVIEAGTPLIKSDGLVSVRRLREIAPDHLIVADMKAMDGGGYEAELAFGAGADMMTVLACASNATISAAVAVARSVGKSVVADLIGVADKPGRASEIAELGVSYLGIHTGTDDQAHGANPLADLEAVSRAVQTPTVVAGGINQSTLPAILALGPAIAIVGSGILGRPDPLAAAIELHGILSAYRGNTG